MDCLSIIITCGSSTNNWTFVDVIVMFIGTHLVQHGTGFIMIIIILDISIITNFINTNKNYYI